MFKSRLENVLKELAQDLAEERLANNRLMAVSGMSVEELTDAFTKGYRLVSPEEKNDQIPDLRVTAEEAAEAIQNLTKAGISQEDIESSDLPLYDPDRKMPESEDAIEFSEKDAIKMLKSKMDGHTDTSYEWAETVRMAIKAIEQTSWIPVTKRLPDDYDRYLITTKDGRVEIIYYGYTDDRPNEVAFHQWDDEGWQCWKPDVTAWMPLPDPHKPQERSE